MAINNLLFVDISTYASEVLPREREKTDQSDFSGTYFYISVMKITLPLALL